MNGWLYSRLNEVQKSWKPQSLHMAAVIPGDGAVTNLSFHRDGRYLAMSTSESSIHLIDAVAGIEKKKVYVKSTGVGKLVFTHHDQSVLFSPERKSNDIRNLCIYDNRIVRYYKGNEHSRHTIKPHV